MPIENKASISNDEEAMLKKVKNYINSSNPFTKVRLKKTLERNLVKAAYRGFSTVIEFLIEQNVDLNATYSSGILNPEYTPLLTALTNEHYETVSLLLSYGVDLTQEINNTPLLVMAAEKQQDEIIKLSINNGADINKALNFAIEHNNRLEIIKTLTKNSKKSEYHCKSLSLAIRKMSDCKNITERYALEELIILLLKENIALDVAHQEIEDYYPIIEHAYGHSMPNTYTPLITTIIEGDFELLSALIMFGAKIPQEFESVATQSENKNPDNNLNLFHKIMPYHHLENEVNDKIASGELHQAIKIGLEAIDSIKKENFYPLITEYLETNDKAKARKLEELCKGSEVKALILKFGDIAIARNLIEKNLLLDTKNEENKEEEEKEFWKKTPRKRTIGFAGEEVHFITPRNNGRKPSRSTRSQSVETLDINTTNENQR